MDDLLDFVLEAHGALRRWPGVSALTAKLAVGSTAAALTLRRRRRAVSPVVPTGLDPLTKRPTVKHHHHCSRQPLMTGY
jgi:hypothetical protein